MQANLQSAGFIIRYKSLTDYNTYEATVHGAIKYRMKKRYYHFGDDYIFYDKCGKILSEFPQIYAYSIHRFYTTVLAEGRPTLIQKFKALIQKIKEKK